jgi:hypothetical protein
MSPKYTAYKQLQGVQGGICNVLDVFEGLHADFSGDVLPLTRQQAEFIQHELSEASQDLQQRLISDYQEMAAEDFNVDRA